MLLTSEGCLRVGRFNLERKSGNSPRNKGQSSPGPSKGFSYDEARQWGGPRSAPAAPLLGASHSAEARGSPGQRFHPRKTPTRPRLSRAWKSLSAGPWLGPVDTRTPRAHSSPAEPGRQAWAGLHMAPLGPRELSPLGSAAAVLSALCWRISTVVFRGRGWVQPVLLLSRRKSLRPA